MKKISACLYFTLLFITNSIFAQIISINDAGDVESNFSLEELVGNVLIDSQCALVDNFSEQVYGQPDDLQTKSYGYFKRPVGSSFPFESGVVLTNGSAFSAGNNVNNSIPFPSFDNGQPGDADLEQALGLSNTFDATFIKFNFTPTSSDFSFSFLMASEEYDGTTECNFADSFAFLLREVGATTYDNLAVLPDNTPISVTNINDSPVCPANTEFFDGYDIGDTNYGGRTVVLTASAIVDPDKIYEIKLVVADQGDAIWDSAIFLEAGSFSLGLDIGEDLTITGGNAACSGETITLDTQVPTTDGDHTWYLDGVEIIGETNSTLEIVTPGEYSVLVEFATNCSATDSIIIEFTENPIANPISDQLFCDDDNDGFWDFDLASLEALVLGGQSNSEFTISYHTSQEDADSNSNPLGSPYVNLVAFQSEQIYARIESNVNPNCYDSTDFEIGVASSPSANAVLFEKCDDAGDGDDTNGFTEFDLNNISAEVLGAQDPSQYNISYHFNQSDADDNLMPLAQLYTNATTNSETIVVRVENVENSNCYATNEIMLVVNPLPVISDEVTLTQCDDDTDGFTLFNLTEANALISDNAASENITFYETQSEAQTGMTADQIVSVTDYPNPIALNGIVYARIENTNGCFRIAKVNLLVATTQIPASFNLNYNVCDDALIDNDNANGIATFDFSSATAQIEALFPIGQSLTITYYTNEQDALAETNAINDISNHRNETSPNVQGIFVRVDSEDINACLGLGEHITLTVDAQPEANTISDYVLCSDTDTAVFDLSTKDSEVIGVQTDVVLISYHLTEQDAINNVPILNATSYTNESNPQSVYVRAQFDNNGNGIGDPGECVRTDITIQLIVNRNPIAFSPDPIIICNDEVETTYNLTIREDQISGGDTTIALAYYESQTDVDNNNPILNPSTYSNTLLDRDIIVLATATNFCTSEVILSLKTIIYADINEMPSIIEECETDNNGFDFFDITRREEEILNGLNPADFTFVYYLSENDAIAGNSNNIVDIFNFENTIINTQTIYSRVQPTTNNCYIIVPITLVVNPVPQVNMAAEYMICLNNLDQIIDPVTMPLLPLPPLETNLNATEFTFQWYKGTEEEVNANPNSIIIDGATSASYMPGEAGNYTVIATNMITDCRIPASTVVYASYPPESITVNVTSETFSSNNMLEVTVIGNGMYEYRIDNGEWQSNNTLMNVAGGERIIYVRDLLQCNEIFYNILVIDYPRFFTPNDDGYHDTWNIYGIATQPNSIIYIFDRYGKLLKQLSPLGRGWDGTYNGSKLPSDDYWFVIEYSEPGSTVKKQFRSHFTLKR